MLSFHHLGLLSDCFSYGSSTKILHECFCPLRKLISLFLNTRQSVIRASVNALLYAHSAPHGSKWFLNNFVFRHLKFISFAIYIASLSGTFVNVRWSCDLNCHDTFIYLFTTCFDVTRPSPGILIVLLRVND
jgi:hypothetical protein